jgi:hypothetical protein
VGSTAVLDAPLAQPECPTVFDPVGSMLPPCPTADPPREPMPPGNARMDARAATKKAERMVL